ncbi:MAG: hypothetical protein M0P57_04535 [Syntrophales bacterium]|jgi:L-alanine-DL-glutamate epimerase-like enolase superfamily enzyme|nr:hypothetical protein [Syntrophales bacterium]MDY0043891.1 enolase C-terminal domain-like protein [Syntrophales bacterium]
MRITNVTATIFKWDELPTVTYNVNVSPVSQSSDLALVAIETDEGITGHAFLGWAMHAGSNEAPKLIRFLKPAVMGQDPLARELLYRRLMDRSRHAQFAAIGAIDCALWDIAGQVAGLPIHNLLGTYRDKIIAYASSEQLPSIESYIEQALELKEAGWKAYKIHPPHFSVRKDIELCQAVRKAVGDDFTLLLDATWHYDYPSALKVGRALEELDFEWYEDPLSDQDIYNYVKLHEKLDIPLVATEFPQHGLDAYAQWLLAKATDALRGDVALKGGITTLVKTAHLAEAFSMNLELHHGGNSLNNLANLHIVSAIRNTSMFEVLLPEKAQKYGVIDDLTVDKDGFLSAPARPGLGAQIDFDLIRAKTVEVLS